jgi:hypothetical protein
VVASKNVSNSCKNTDSNVWLLKVSILKADFYEGMASSWCQGMMTAVLRVVGASTHVQ